MTDTSAGIAYQIDLVMAALGADTGNTAAWRALTDYHVLRRLQTVISARSDFDATAIKAGRSQLFMHLQDDQGRSQPRRSSRLPRHRRRRCRPARSTGQPTGSNQANRMTTETPTWQRLDAALIEAFDATHGRSG